MKPTLISLFFILLILLSYQISLGVKEKQNPNLRFDKPFVQRADISQEPGKISPPMDMTIPSAFETASFGLG